MSDSPRYPDPSDWVTRLHRDLSSRAEIYHLDHLRDARRPVAAAQLASVIAALMELPPFRNDRSLYPLKDILTLLADLEMGKRHPWSVPENTGGTSATTIAQNELQGYVRVVVAFLKANGFGTTEAYRRVAKGLTASGRAAKDGEPFAWRTVQQWCNKAPLRGDKIITSNFERWIAGFNDGARGQPQILGNGRPATEKEIAGSIADRMWTLDHLRDRIIS